MIIALYIYLLCMVAFILHRLFDWAKSDRPLFEWGTLIGLLTSPIVFILAAIFRIDEWFHSDASANFKRSLKSLIDTLLRPE